ncbi:MAG: hypothetical protein HW375_1531 [Anaerolineales bacterium]|nr:hypothetical protein [Anaerolineales bacterium]
MRQQLQFTGQRAGKLQNEIRPAKSLFRGVGDGRAGADVVRIEEAGAFAGAALDIYRVAVAHEHRRAGGWKPDPELERAALLGDANVHGPRLPSTNRNARESSARLTSFCCSRSASGSIACRFEGPLRGNTPSTAWQTACTARDARSMGGSWLALNGLVCFCHPRASRFASQRGSGGPGVEGHGQPWIPAFAGMTLSLMSRAGVSAQRVGQAASSSGAVFSRLRAVGLVSTNAAAGTGGRNQ